MGRTGRERQAALEQRRRDAGLLPLTIWVPAAMKDAVRDVVAAYVKSLADDSATPVRADGVSVSSDEMPATTGQSPAEPEQLHLVEYLERLDSTQPPQSGDARPGKKEFGRLVRAKRQARSWELAYLAGLVDIDVRTMARIEKAQIDVSPELKAALLAVLGFDHDDGVQQAE